MTDRDDSFELYDLRVEVVATERPMVCGHRAGDWLEVRGEALTLPPGQSFSMYALAALLPLLPAKQRATHPNDWMTTDAEIACPDPNCGARFRITRIGTRTFRHSAVTAVPLLAPSERPRVEGTRVQLAEGYSISRVLKGGWQLAGGHGAIDPSDAMADMERFVDAGITTFDCADIYTGVEALIGEWLRSRRARATVPVQVHTKYVPDLDALPTHSRTDVTRGIDRSLVRLGVERLDVVQLHWWDYDIRGYVEAAMWLDELRRAGKIRHVGLTNFDLPRLREIVDAGVPIVSHQVQYSVLDRRPSGEMAAYCAEHGIGLLCYGALAGGFLSHRYLGVAAPGGALENRSLVKYRLIIDEFGGWDCFERVLTTLDRIAARYAVGIGAVALRWVLDQSAVAGVIVGARHARHLADVARAATLMLDDDDRAAIADVQRESCGPNGDVYALERLKGHRHASVMRYSLNRESHDAPRHRP